MRFLGTIKSAEGMQPPAELMQAMGAFVQEARAAGVVRDTGGLAPSADSVRVRVENGNAQYLDGPFAESKEVVGGYVIYDVSSKEEALEWTRRFVDLHLQHWPDFRFECELRQMYSVEDAPRS
jgi:hypothetical protein